MKPLRLSPPLYLGIAMIAIAVLVSSCGSPPTDSTQPTVPSEPTESAETSPAATEPAPTPSETPQPDNMSSDLSQSANVPDQVVNQVKTAIAQSADVSTEAIQITSAEPQTWPNGCLGLASADEFCTQMLVEGWRIEATDGETTWIYRTDATGSQVRQETRMT